MRIAIDARYLSGEFSGIGTYSESLLKRLVPADPDNQYCIFVHESFDRDFDVRDNAEIIPCAARPLSFYTLSGFRRAARETGADLLHSFFPVTPLFTRLPTIVTVHDLQPLQMPEFTARRFYLLRKAYDVFYRWIYPRSIKRAKYVVAVSHSTRRAIAELVPEARANTTVIYSGLDPSCGAPVDENTEGQVQEKYELPDRYVLYLGSTRPNKNLPNMIQAFSRMRERHEDMKDLYFVLVVSADRFFEDCRRAIRKHRLQKRMRVYQQISETEKRCFYARASALFFATKNEGFGLPLLEAQACGLPVLAANHGALPEIAHGSALLTDPDDLADMSRKLHAIVSDAALRQRLINAGRSNVARFQWEKTAEQIRQMYHYLM